MNPATQQIDFYIRSPQQNPKNQAEPRSVHALLWHGGDLEMTPPRFVLLLAALRMADTRLRSHARVQPA